MANIIRKSDGHPVGGVKGDSRAGPGELVVKVGDATTVATYLGNGARDVHEVVVQLRRWLDVRAFR